MTGILDKFFVEHAAHGAKVMVRSFQLTANCRSEEEIDAAIDLAIDDLEACRREMKRRVALDHRGSMFEGWVTSAE